MPIRISIRARRIVAGGLITTVCLVVTGLPIRSNADEAEAKVKMELGRKIFTQIAVPQCGVCHTLADAGTSGTIGAKLEELKPDAARVANAVRDGVGVMPSYADKLTAEQIEAVAYYVSRAAGGAQ